MSSTNITENQKKLKAFFHLLSVTKTITYYITGGNILNM
jgi:hypothetical protein